MIYRIKELPDIELKHPNRLRTVTRKRPRELPEPFSGRMCAFANARRTRVKDERSIKKRREDAMDRVMKHPVTHGGLGDLATLRVMDDESGILAVRILSTGKVSCELQQMLFHPLRECQHVRFFHLPPLKFPPRGENIFRRDNLFKQASMNTPPILSLSRSFFTDCRNCTSCCISAF